MKKLVSLAACVGIIAIIGCSRSAPTSTPSTSHTGSTVDSSKYLLSSEPKDPQDVITVRKDSKHDDDIVVVGRIGGSKNPLVEGRAAFSIVDVSLKSCADIGADNCPTPWDYC